MQTRTAMHVDATTRGAAESESRHLGTATHGDSRATLTRKRPSRRKSGDATVNVGLRNCHWVPVYHRTPASWRRHALKRHAGARKAECLPRLRGRGKTSEQILEKLAPATLTPIANMAAERAGNFGTNLFRKN
ncbi:hypothetical protein [Achromobacter sp.]|uniref:hypothetical protein n=1 Tax=Achromobacter sp. TaxID=134375 RepID=UPI0028A1BED3|nr:hypothetical protein [Achromobacter sp.]